MIVHPYLNFDGNCREAMEFYAGIFEAEPIILTYGDMPGGSEYPMTEVMKSRVLHGKLEVCKSLLLFSDVMPGQEFIRGSNICISLFSDDKERLTACFGQLAEGGTVEIPLDQTFWSELYGFVTDKFGISWQINFAH